MVAKITAWKRHKVEYILKIIIAIILGFFIYVYMLASMAYAWEHNKYSLYFYAALFLIVLAWEKSDIIMQHIMGQSLPPLHSSYCMWLT